MILLILMHLLPRTRWSFRKRSARSNTVVLNKKHIHMGRFTDSCFKIISCGGSNDSVDLDAPSSENVPKKCRTRWSFRKRSARSNTVVLNKKHIHMGRFTDSCFKIISCGGSNDSVDLDAPSSEEFVTGAKPILLWRNLENSEIVDDQEEIERIASIRQKFNEVFGNDEEEEIEERNEEEVEDYNENMNDTEPRDPVSETEVKPVPDESESAILVIQAAVRRFLAQSQLEKHKNAVKLQAAVRGHLVRIHAVGTLRCVVEAALPCVEIICSSEQSKPDASFSQNDEAEVENKKFEEEAEGLDEVVGDSKDNQNIDIVMPIKHDNVDDFKTEKLKLGSTLEQKIDDCASDADIGLQFTSPWSVCLCGLWSLFLHRIS